MIRVFIFLLSFIVLFGCVSKSTHEEKVKALEGEILSITKDRGKLQDSLAEMKKALSEMQAREAEQQKRLQEFRDLTRRFQSLIDAGTLSVTIKDGRMVVSLGSDVLFPSGSARLSPEGALAIRDVTANLVSIPDKRYQIEGHTDNVPIATAQYPSNWELAAARALTVVKRMIDEDMPPTRVSAASYGDSQPVASNDTLEGKALNRRIEIVIVPDLSSLPGYEELKKLSEKQAQESKASGKEKKKKK